MSNNLILKNNYRDIVDMIDAKYGFKINSTYESSVTDIIGELNALIKSYINFDYEDAKLIVDFYEQFLLESSAFFPDTVSDNYKSYLKKVFIETYIEVMFNSIPNFSDFYNSILDVNQNINQICAEFQFNTFYLECKRQGFSNKDIANLLRKEFNLSKYYDDIDGLLKEHLEYQESNINYNYGDYFNIGDIYYKLQSELGALEFDNAELEFDYGQFHSTDEGALLAELLKEEERSHIAKGRTGYLRFIIGHSQRVINPKLLINGCSCVSNSFHHTIYIYEDYVSDTSQKLLGE